MASEAPPSLPPMEPTPYDAASMKDIPKPSTDFFGYNKNLELQYRGRIKELKNLKPVGKGDSDLNVAMKLIATSGRGPKIQIPSMGCNIKWFK